MDRSTVVSAVNFSMSDKSPTHSSMLQIGVEKSMAPKSPGEQCHGRIPNQDSHFFRTNYDAGLAYRAQSANAVGSSSTASDLIHLAYIVNACRPKSELKYKAIDNKSLSWLAPGIHTNCKQRTSWQFSPRPPHRPPHRNFAVYASIPCALR